MGSPHYPIIWYLGHRYYILGCIFDKEIERRYRCFGVTLKPVANRGREIVIPARQLDVVVESQPAHRRVPVKKVFFDNIGPYPHADGGWVVWVDRDPVRIDGKKTANRIARWEHERREKNGRKGTQEPHQRGR